MTIFIFKKEIEQSRNFSRDVSNCFDLLVDWCPDGTEIRLNLFLFFVALNFNKNFVSNFSQVPRCIFINVVASSSNRCLKTVNHLERLEFSSAGRFSQFFCLCSKTSQLHMIFNEETFVIKVWYHLCCYLLFMLISKLSKRQSRWNFESNNSQRFEFQFQLGCFYVLWLMLFQRWWTSISEMKKVVSSLFFS